jgi:hypothetical protein
MISFCRYYTENGSLKLLVVYDPMKILKCLI